MFGICISTDSELRLHSTQHETWNAPAVSDNNQNSLYYFIRNAHLAIITLHIVLY